MEKDVPLFSWIKQLAVLAVIACLTIGCATGARELPPDYCSVNAQKRLSLEDFSLTALVSLTCAKIDEELKTLESDCAMQVRDITAKRGKNQAVVYVGSLFFLPALLATDNSAEAKAKIANINRAKDELYKLRAFKRCPSRLKN